MSRVVRMGIITASMGIVGLLYALLALTSMSPGMQRRGYALELDDHSLARYSRTQESTEFHRACTLALSGETCR